MIQDKTIKMTVIRDGKTQQIDVRMRYCAAAETGYEIMTGKPMDVFFPKFGKDEDGNDIIVEPAKATSQDYMYLAIAAIVAAYERTKEQVPITDADILYDASPTEIAELLTTVVMLRGEWYKVPEVVKPDMEHEGSGKNSKNAQPLTTSSKK